MTSSLGEKGSVLRLLFNVFVKFDVCCPKHLPHASDCVPASLFCVVILSHNILIMETDSRQMMHIGAAAAGVLALPVVVVQTIHN